MSLISIDSNEYINPTPRDFSRAGRLQSNLASHRDHPQRVEQIVTQTELEKSHVHVAIIASCVDAICDGISFGASIHCKFESINIFSVAN